MNGSEIKGYDSVKLQDRLRDIRKNTGLRRAHEFYFKYLAPYNVANITKESSADDYIKKLENGSTPITPQILLIYANIAECSIDSLITGKEYEEGSRRERLSARDVCRMIMAINERYELDFGYINPYDEYTKQLPENDYRNEYRLCFSIANNLDLFSDTYNYNQQEKDIRDIKTFFQNYTQVKSITELTPEMYNMLCEKYLEKVSDDPAPCPE